MAARRGTPEPHLPPRGNRWPSLPAIPIPTLRHERHRITATNLEQWLDYRRASASNLRKPGTLEDLARRRKRMNPRLSDEWLRYLVSIGRGVTRMAGAGSWTPLSVWVGSALAPRVVAAPSPRPPSPASRPNGHHRRGNGLGHQSRRNPSISPAGGRIIPFDDTGHFIHIEQPRRVADSVLEFMA